MNKKFQGVYAVVVTPFKEDGAFDLPTAKKHLDWLIESGITGICVMGATGEYQSVTNQEHKDYIREILPYIKDRVSVLVGVTRERPEEVVELMKNDWECGASAAMILPPFYCHPSQDEIVEHYRYISERSEMPFIVYNNPGSAGVDMDRQTIRKVLALPSSQILKESTGDIHRLTEAVLDAPEYTSVFCGCDNLAMESFAMGAVGWISMAANFAPRDCIALHKAVQCGELARAKEIYARLLPALNLLEATTKSGAAIKYILDKYYGIDVGYMRRPRLGLTDAEKNEIDAALDYSTLC